MLALLIHMNIMCEKYFQIGMYYYILDVNREVEGPEHTYAPVTQRLDATTS